MCHEYTLFIQLLEKRIAKHYNKRAGYHTNQLEGSLYMELFSILCFIKLAQCSKFYEAAEQLHISQSSFSKHIQSLEHTLGAKLFVRNTHGSALTRAGEELLPYAESISQEYARAESLIDTYKKNLDKRLVVYAHSSLSHYKLSEKLFQFQNMYPDAQLEIHEVENQVAVRALQTDSSTVGIVFSASDTVHESFNRCILAHDELVVLVSRQHNLAEQARVHISMLRHEVFQILLKRQEQFLYSFILKQCATAGFTPAITPYALWYSTIPGILKTHNFVSVLPRKIAESICTSDTKIIALDGVEPLMIEFMKNTENKSDIANALYKFVQHFAVPPV